jgi:hypothetical protein
MKYKIRFAIRQRSSLSFVAAVLFVLILAAVPTVAQSGRRLPNSKPVAASQPEETPTPAPVVPKKTKKPFSVVVGIDRDSFAYLPLQYYSLALEGCAESIDKSPSVQVVAQESYMNRGEAVRRAKNETENYIVWLQLRGESLDAEHGINNISEIYVEYAVLAPGTAKQIASGRTYQRAVRKGDVVIGPAPSSRRNEVLGQYMIREAARDAGKRVLEALSVSAGRTLPPWSLRD